MQCGASHADTGAICRTDDVVMLESDILLFLTGHSILLEQL